MIDRMFRVYKKALGISSLSLGDNKALSPPIHGSTHLNALTFPSSM